MLKLPCGELEGLKAILEEDAEGKVKMTQCYVHTVMFSSPSNHLYLKATGMKYLVISNITINKKRSGVATKILNWLDAYGKEKGFKGVMIESTLTIEMNRFAQKNGFKPVPYQGTEIEGEFYGNWVRDYQIVEAS